MYLLADRTIIATLEKLQADRRELLLAGKPWKTKKKDQLVKDNNCTNLTLKLVNKEIT